MRITATFSDGLKQQLDGRATGDEFIVTARARIVGADEALVELRREGEADPEFFQRDLEVRLLLSHGTVTETPADPTPTLRLVVSCTCPEAGLDPQCPHHGSTAGRIG